jgi:SAM-dependent methyltransferase
MSGVSTSDFYERFWSAGGHAPAGNLHGGLRDLLATHVQPTDACLDLGCGDGGTCGVWLSENAREYVGVDISSGAVALARSRGLKAQQIKSVGALPFNDRSFDAVVCSEVLEHLLEPQVAIAEAKRVLRPGGLLLVTTPNAVYWRRRLDLARGIVDPYGDALSIAEPWRDPHIRFFTPTTLGRLLGYAGFEGVAVVGHSEKPLLVDVPIARRWVEHVEPAPPHRWALRTPLGSRLLNSGQGRVQTRLIRRAPAWWALRLAAVARKPS